MAGVRSSSPRRRGAAPWPPPRRAGAARRAIGEGEALAHQRGADILAVGGVDGELARRTVDEVMILLALIALVSVYFAAETRRIARARRV